MEGKRRPFDDYDFEEAYRKSLDDLSEEELSRYLKNNPGTAYQTKTTKAGNQLEADIYPVFRKRSEGPRTERRNSSRPAQRGLNDRRARRYLTNLLNANFGSGDIWATFTYDEDHLPDSEEEAGNLFRNFIRRINRIRKKEGKQNIRYICVTEFGETRIHHHVVMEGNIDRDRIEALWKYGKRNQTRRISADPDTGISGIAAYITKQSKDPKRRKGRKRWTASRGLKKPQITKSLSRIGKRTAQRMAGDHEYLRARIEKEYPGYRFIDAEVYSNDINGGFYIYVRMTRD